MKIYKGLIFILALIMILLPLFSCAEKAGKTEAEISTSAKAASENGITEDPRFAIKEEIPELNFNGKTFNILYPTWSMYMDYYFTEDEIGEKLIDAVYRRTKNVEERFNVDLTSTTKGYIDTVFSSVQKAVKAGTDDYQLALTHCISGVDAFATTGIAQDWNKIPHVDFKKPWWNQSMNESMSINGVLLTAVSDYILFDPNVVYFNKELAKNLDIGDMYSLVKSGGWTWTKLTEIAKIASKDVDGNGLYDENDQYGLVSHADWMIDSAVQACDMTLTKISDEGYPVTNLMNEKFGTLMQQLYDLFYVGNQTFIGAWDPNNLETTYESKVPMSSGRVLFHMDPLSAGKRYRVYDVEFGILPFPKYDETQKEYKSLSWNGFMVVPQTADKELVGAICESLAAESYRLTVPAYYDVLLTSKIARDVESTEMLDIVKAGACYDFGMNYANFNALSFPISNLLRAKSADYASFLDKNSKAFETAMTKVYNKIVEIYSEN